MGRHITRMEDNRVIFKILIGKGHEEGLDTGGRIILGKILNK